MGKGCFVGDQKQELESFWNKFPGKAGRNQKGASQLLHPSSWDSSVLRRAWGQVGKGEVKISTWVKKKKISKQVHSHAKKPDLLFWEQDCFSFFLLQGDFPNHLTSLWARSWQLCEVHLPGSVLPAEVVAFLPLPLPFKYSFLLLMASPLWFSSRTWDVVQGKNKWQMRLKSGMFWISQRRLWKKEKCLSSVYKGGERTNERNNF